MLGNERRHTSERDDLQFHICPDFIRQNHGANPFAQQTSSNMLA